MNKNEELGINLIHHLYDAGKITTIKEIADTLGCSKTFLQQIAGKLTRAGLIKSAQGPNGGYSLSAIPTLFQVKQCLGSVEIRSTGRARYIEFLTTQFFKSVPVTESVPLDRIKAV